MKDLLKYVGYYAIFLIFLVFVSSLLNLIGVNSSITNLIIFLFNTISFFVFGYKSGKKASSKGYLEGLKVSGLFLLILLIINIFTSNNIFSLTTLIYYLVLLLSGVFGGSIGINKKEDTN